MFMSIPEKNIFSILRQAGPVFGKNAKYMAIITLLAFIPVFVFRMFLPAEYAAAFYALSEAWSAAIATGTDSAALVAMLAHPTFSGAADYVMMSFGIELVFFSLSVAAATYLVGKHLAQEEYGFDGMFSAVMPKFPKLVITTAIAAAIIYLPLSFGGTFLFILAIYFAVGMVFYQQVVVDMGNWGLGAISISRRFIQGRWFRVFFGITTLVILYAIVFMAIEFFATIIGARQNIFIALPMFLLQHFVLSFFAVALALWYFDLKRKNEIIYKRIEQKIAEGLKNLENFEESFGKREKEKEDEE